MFRIPVDPIKTLPSVSNSLWEYATMERGYVWEPLYVAAILETDDARLPKRIAEARAAMNARIARLADIEGNWVERRAMEAALHALRVLHGERLGGRTSVVA
jgi:hypothetical protein